MTAQSKTYGSIYDGSSNTKYIFIKAIDSVLQQVLFDGVLYLSCSLLTVGGIYFLTACQLCSHVHINTHTTQRPLYSSVPVLSASGGIWVMRNKQGLCVCYFLFVPQWTHSAGAEEGEQRRWWGRRRGRRSGAGWGPRRGPLPGAEAPDPSASARGLPTSNKPIPRPAPQDLVQVPEKE